MNETGHYHVMRIGWDRDFWIAPDVYARQEDADRERVFLTAVGEPDVFEWRVYICDDPGHRLVVGGVRELA